MLGEDLKCGCVNSCAADRRAKHKCIWNADQMLRIYTWHSMLSCVAVSDVMVSVECTQYVHTWHSMLSCVAVSRAMASSSWARTVTSVWEMRSSRLR